jgi:hypothetical protein
LNAVNGPVRPPVPTSTLAIISLVFGILGWSFFPTLGAIVAIITGHLAKNEIRKSNGALGGEGLAKAGLILGYLHIAIVLLVICAVILIWVLGFGSIFFLSPHGR